MARIPDFVIEYFLLGRTRREALERYTQDGGIVSDVWLAFAKDLSAPHRVLVAPGRGTSAVDLGYALHGALTAYRQQFPAGSRTKPGVSPLENFVAVTLYLDELLRIVLPMTNWWHDKSLSALHRKAVLKGQTLDWMLQQAIRNKLGHEENEVATRQTISESEEIYVDRRIIQAASLAALIGVFRAAEADPAFIASLPAIDPNRPEGVETFVQWIHDHADQIAEAARIELSRPFEPSLLTLPPEIRGARPGAATSQPDEPPVLVQRVFLDRQASLADTAAICTIKADAADRVFEISCRNVTWAIIDSGIATTHPAFLDHDAKDRRGQPIVPPPHRIKATYDFTRIERIRNFDLIASPEGSAARLQEITDVAIELEHLPGRKPSPTFRQDAIRHLENIARQLEQRIPPDWGLIEPLIRLGNDDDGSQLVSDHGTHVAGILAGDWRGRKPGPDGRPEILLRGVCRDINVYDLRVIHPANRKSTEFALLAALEFVQWVNARAAGDGPAVHGVNISLSIPHDVRNYGCGATPVCVACDRLVNAGVVVVAAAGNRGWNEQEIGFGNFVFCSITDPGNAREVITVGSTHRLKPHTFGISYFSSRGPTGDGRIKPDLVAPGEQIRGPIRGGADDELDGTSMAAPFVSGAAAMLIARHRELIGNPARIKRILCESATDLGRERYFQGHGLLDVLRALQSV